MIRANFTFSTDCWWRSLAKEFNILSIYKLNFTAQFFKEKNHKIFKWKRNAFRWEVFLIGQLCIGCWLPFGWKLKSMPSLQPKSRDLEWWGRRCWWRSDAVSIPGSWNLKSCLIQDDSLNHKQWIVCQEKEID